MESSASSAQQPSSSIDSVDVSTNPDATSSSNTQETLPSSHDQNQTSSDSQSTPYSSQTHNTTSSTDASTPSSSINNSAVNNSSSESEPPASSSNGTVAGEPDRINTFVSGDIEHIYGKGTTPDSSKILNGATSLLKENRYFDPQGALKHWDQYDPTSTYIKTTQLSTDGVIRQVTQWYGPDSLDYIQNRDTNSKPTDLTKYENNKKVTVQYYNPAEQITSQIQFDSFEIKNAEINFINGIKSERADFLSDGITRATYTTYDDSGIVAQQTSYHPDGTTLKTVSNYIPNSSGSQMTLQKSYDTSGKITLEHHFHAEGWEETQIQYDYGRDLKVVITLNAAGEIVNSIEVGP